MAPLDAHRAVLRLASPAGAGAAFDPEWLTRWLGDAVVRVAVDEPDLLAILRRSRPSVVLIDGRTGARARAACEWCKRDPYTALVPCVVFEARGRDAHETVALFEAGADEVIRDDSGDDEASARLDAVLRRATRDLAAQPTTGLPGPPAIDRVIATRLRDGVPFAACYADLDHFKEYNDRYGFHEGDRVIRMLARLLYDVARGAGGDEAFVGHIGGDDFLCVIPLESATDACQVMVDTFDMIAPLQYNAADRRAGYYLGKDRRGKLHRVPLMTLSIGVATTERRRYASSADVSRLASEMKSFAKTMAGSVFAFDRRGDEATPSTAPFAEIE